MESADEQPLGGLVFIRRLVCQAVSSFVSLGGWTAKPRKGEGFGPGATLSFSIAWLLDTARSKREGFDRLCPFGLARGLDSTALTHAMRGLFRFAWPGWAMLLRCAFRHAVLRDM